MGRVIAHPFLLAAWPVLFLWAANAGETGAGQVAPALAGACAVALVCLGLFWLVVRDLRRAGLATSVLALAALTYGHIENQVGPRPWLLPVWLGASVLLVVAGLRARGALAELTTLANGLAAVFVVLALVGVGSGGAQASTAAAPAVGADTEGVNLQWSGDGAPRDIYYLVLDRYGSERNLREHLGVDVGPFVDSLEGRGFEVLEDARANHLRTAHSLASLLNLGYLLPLAERYGTHTDDLQPVVDLLEQHRVGRVLRQAGYRYVHIGSWWDPTATNSAADLDWGYDGASDFLTTFLDTTILAALPERSAPQPSLREQHRAAPPVQFGALHRVPRIEGPTFTFAHILLPHEPYVFAADGGLVTEREDDRRTRRENFTNQVTYLHAQVDALLDELLAGPPESDPVVIIQADEGPHPPRYDANRRRFDWTRATDAELDEKFSTLSAWYLPGADGTRLDPSMSAVNTFRVLFNTYFSTDLDLLDDRSFTFRDDDHLYDFTDITDRLP